MWVLSGSDTDISSNSQHSSYPFLICSLNRDPGQSLIGYGVIGKTWPALPAIQRQVSILTWKSLNNRKSLCGCPVSWKLGWHGKKSARGPSPAQGMVMLDVFWGREEWSHQEPTEAPALVNPTACKILGRTEGASLLE